MVDMKVYTLVALLMIMGMSGVAMGWHYGHMFGHRDGLRECPVVEETQAGQAEANQVEAEVLLKTLNGGNGE